MKSRLFVMGLLALGISASAMPSRLPLSILSNGQGTSFSHQPTDLATTMTVATSSEHASHGSQHTKADSSAAAPAISVLAQYYSIRGNSASELRSQMNHQGPFDSRENRHYDARTDWSVQWSYQHSGTGRQCRASNTAVQIEVTIIYPQWSAPAGAPASLVAEWQRYQAALQLHEYGHRDNGLAAGRDVLQALNSLPAYSSCQALDRAANATAQSVIKQYNQRDLDYDQLTSHGYSQGAVFPAVTTASQ